MKPPKTTGRRKPLAMALRSPHLKPQVIKSKKIYSRKGRPDKTERPFSWAA